MNYFIFYLFKDIKTTLKKLKNRWLQTILSIIGIMVGVISITILLSISEGISKKAIKNIEDFGLNNIKVKSINKQKILNIEDFKIIKSLIGNNGFIAPKIKYEKNYINYSNKDFYANIYLSNQFFLKTENLKLQKGRNMLPFDIKTYNQIAIISIDLSKKYNIKINDFLKINSSIFRIVGISSIHSKINNFIEIPISTKPFNKNNNNFNTISIFIKNKNNIFSFSSLIKNKLLQKHKNIKDLELIIPLKVIEKSRETSKFFSIIIMTIAILSIVTGGVSVMNIMLSNISEQTREIGLKTALGATPQRIIQYYLIYAIIMTLSGGILGIIIGYSTIWLISIFSTTSIAFSIKALIISLFISIFSGIIFGLYPAIRASKIEPMIALKEF